MTNRIIIPLFLSLVSVFSLTAQNLEQDSFLAPEMVLKWSFSSLANIHPALQFGFEHRMKNRKHALYYELGTFIPYNGEQNTLYPVYGFRLRNEYRYYFRKPRQTRNNFLGFVYMPQLKFNNNQAYIERDEGQYSQRFKFKENYFTNKILLTYGANRVGKERKKVFFEWAVSVGIQTRTVFITGLPDGVNPDFRSTSWFPAFFNLESNDLEPEGTKLHGFISFSLRIGKVMR